jgi:hypothetical protein
MDDGTRTAESLAAWLRDLHFTDLPEERATARIVDAVVQWGENAGLARLPPGAERLPAAGAAQGPLRARRGLRPRRRRPADRVEVDRLDRQRTVDKLLSEAAAGRLAIWVRWGRARSARRRCRCTW